MYKEKEKSFLKHIDFILLDAICVEISVLIAYWIRFGMQDIPAYINRMMLDGLYQKFMILVFVLHICIVAFLEPYSGILRRNRKDEFKAVMRYNIYLMSGIIIYMFMQKTSVLYSRFIVFLVIILNIILSFLAREVYKQQLNKKNRKSKNQECILIVSPYNKVEKLIRQMKGQVGSIRIVGVILMDKKTVESDGYIMDIPIVGNMNDLYEFVRTNVVDEVMFYKADTELDEVIEILISMGVTTHICIDSLVCAPKTALNSVNGIPVITASSNVVKSKQLLIKRIIDIVFGLIGSSIAMVVTLLYAPIIWVIDPGPVFFKQDRVGKNGRIFKIWKFRTMYTDAEKRKEELMQHNKMQGHMFKMDNDPRIIGQGSRFSLGEFMRKTSLDELPQFFNILMGSMSLVGTRPPTVQEYEQYELHHLGRLGAKPGLTGMWQVTGRSQITDFEKVVELDKYYIDHFSLGLDIKIILKTIKVVFGMVGSM